MRGLLIQTFAGCSIVQDSYSGHVRHRPRRRKQVRTNCEIS